MDGISSISKPQALALLKPVIPALLLGLAMLASSVPFLLVTAYRDYQAFLALGPGGTPLTPAGYVRVKALSLFALRNPRKPRPVSKDCPEGYLSAIPTRTGPRPTTKGIAPHRQITQTATQAVYEQLELAIQLLASSDEKLCLETSCFEKHTIGLFSLSRAPQTRGGEICHPHPSDGSLHLTLHAADAKKVLEAGWGERHPIALGGWFERFVPAGFTMIYAPRSDAEIAVAVRIIRAAAWYVEGQAGETETRGQRRDSGYVSADEE